MTSSTRSRGYLPHLETQEAIYFVAFRLADSLPRELVLQLRKERDSIEAASLAGATTQGDLSRLRELRALLKRVERCLDRGLGSCHLRDSRVAGIVAEALRHFHGQRYRLFAWCVMPDHVHVLFSPLREHTLDTILHSWKSYSAQRLTRFLVARVPSGSASISITSFGINPRFEKSRITFETIPKKPGSSTGPGSKSCSLFRTCSSFRTAGFQPALLGCGSRRDRRSPERQLACSERPRRAAAFPTMARQLQLHTSRSQLDGLLDPRNVSVTLDTITWAALYRCSGAAHFVPPASSRLFLDCGGLTPRFIAAQLAAPVRTFILAACLPQTGSSDRFFFAPDLL